MPEFKPLSKEALPAALEKARHYRLLNQPWQAESICRDILQVDPDHQDAIYALVLAITDQFEGKFKTSLNDVLELAGKLKDEYQLAYCRGLIFERQAVAALKRSTPHAGFIAYDFLVRAMQSYEVAEKNRPKANDESILRWNCCARIINLHNLQPSPEEDRSPQPFLDV